MEILAISPAEKSFISFFFDRSLWDLWLLFLLCMGRIVSIIAFAPFLGGKVLPDPMKLGYGVALTFVFFPFLIVQSKGSSPMSFDIPFMFLMVKEILIGCFIGFLASIPFYMAQGAGSLIDHERGSQSLQVTDPSTQVQSSPLGLLYNNTMIVLFFLVGGPFLFFDAITTTFQLFPVDQFMNPSFFAKDTPLWHMGIKLMHTFMVVTIQLSAPCLIALLMSDLFLGIANRMAPQVQISFLMWSMKSYVGLAILWAGWWFILKQMDQQGITWMKTMRQLIDSYLPK